VDKTLWVWYGVMMKKPVGILLTTTVLAGIALSGNEDLHIATEVVLSEASLVEEAFRVQDGAVNSKTVTITASDRERIENQWGASRISVLEAWSIADSFAPVLVAVLDTGISPDAWFNDRIEVAKDFTGSKSTDDEDGHGTHMASTIAAIAPNASFINLKVADDHGRCDTATVAKAVYWAANHGAQVINLSLEVDPSSELEKAIRHAWQKGAIIVAAAGNNGTFSPAYPAAYPSAIAVAAINQEDSLSVLSNHGDWVDVAAPGFKIDAELSESEYDCEITGTSPAAAHVSGVAALLFGVADNELVNDEIRAAIEDSCELLAVKGIGKGLIDALAAMLEVSEA